CCICSRAVAGMSLGSFGGWVKVLNRHERTCKAYERLFEKSSWNVGEQEIERLVDRPAAVLPAVALEGEAASLPGPISGEPDVGQPDRLAGAVRLGAGDPGDGDGEVGPKQPADPFGHGAGHLGADGAMLLEQVLGHSQQR